MGPIMGLVSSWEEKEAELFLPYQGETQRKIGCLQTRKQTYTQHSICQHLDLGLPHFQKNRNNLLLFKPLSLIDEDRI